MKTSFRAHTQNIAITLLTVILGLVAIETSAGIIWNQKYNEWLGKQLHGYDRLDHERSIIIPTANTVVTVAVYRAGLQRHGKTLGLRTFEKSKQHQMKDDSGVLFRINKYGFKGPEISIPKPDSTF